MFSTLLAYVSSGLRSVANIFSQVHVTNDSSERQPLVCDLRSTLLQVNEQSSHQTFTLPGDRTLGFATFGAEAGPIVFFLHGFGDSRLLGALFHEPSKAQGLRIVAVDRPGIGLSTPPTEPQCPRSRKRHPPACRALTGKNLQHHRRQRRRPIRTHMRLRSAGRAAQDC
jgi:hypothetical protein